MGTVQLEFVYLAILSKQIEYAIPALNVVRHLDTIKRPPAANGLHTLYVDLKSGQFTGSRWSLGALGDSFYEYLLKVCLIFLLILLLFFFYIFFIFFFFFFFFFPFSSFFFSFLFFFSNLFILFLFKIN
jgi:hypothetical protein